MDTGYLRVHIKTLIPPFVSIETMIASMRVVYSRAQIQVSLVGTEALDLPALVDLSVGKCDATISAQQGALFANRNNVQGNDVVGYAVRSMVPPFDGCSAHPPNEPGVVVAQNATQWTLAHEIGHLLGLGHVDDDDYLMTGSGTENITNPPPRLSEAEIAAMHQSPLITHLDPKIAAVKSLLAAHDSFEEKVAKLPGDADEVLVTLAASDDSGTASRAVYLASLRKTAASVDVVRKGLTHPAVHVRVAAAAALKNLRVKDRRALTVLLDGECDVGIGRFLKEASRGTARKGKGTKRLGQ
jgi:hypothetical protein